MAEYVSREYLLNEYDRQHQGPPGGAKMDDNAIQHTECVGNALGALDEVEELSRYIDANKMADELSKVPWHDRKDEKQAVRMVKEFPAADVKPVVHAHWYVDDGCAYCSNCRNNFRKVILKAVKYCPMCGAQIEGYGGHPDAGPPTPYDLLYEEGGANTT